MIFEQIKCNGKVVKTASGLENMDQEARLLSVAFPSLVFELSATNGMYKPEPHTLYKNGVECFCI